METKAIAELLAKEVIELRKLSAEVKEKEREVNRLKALMSADLDKIGSVTYKSSKARFNVMSSTVPDVKDWDKLFAYILQSESTDLVQKRIATIAWRERHDSGIIVPGVSPFEKNQLKVTIL